MSEIHIQIRTWRCFNNLLLIQQSRVQDDYLFWVFPSCCGTSCPTGRCPWRSEGSQPRTCRCPLGFLRRSGGHRPPRLRPRPGGRAPSRCAARRPSGRCRPGPSACWRPTGSQSARTGCRCRCADCAGCAAHPRCRLQTAPGCNKDRHVHPVNLTFVFIWV